MTLGAAPGNIERSFAVMTATARQPLLHLLHVNVRVGSVSLEELGMTIRAAEKGKVEFMAEHYQAEIRNPYRDLFCQMAGTALGEPKSTNLVVTQTAGLSLFHLRHSHRRILFADLEERIMAESTVVPQLFQMRIMRERDSPYTLSSYGGTLVILCIQAGRNNKQK